MLITIFTIVSYMPLDYTEVGWTGLVCVCAHDLESFAEVLLVSCAGISGHGDALWGAACEHYDEE